MHKIDAFEFHELLLLLYAVVVGLVIGAQREYHSKSAGLRTLMLVCVGSCVLTLLSIHVSPSTPDRIASNIVQGIGFLGAGAIFRDNDRVNGLTTACSIWVVAALGMAIGAGYVWLALCATLVVLFVLQSLVYVEKRIEHWHRSQFYTLTISREESNIAQLCQIFSEAGLKPHVVGITRNGNAITVRIRAAGKNSHHQNAIAALLAHTTITRMQV